MSKADWEQLKQARREAAAEFRTVRRQAMDGVKGVAQAAARGAWDGAAAGAASGLEEFPTLPWKRAGRPVRSRTPLSRDRIVQVAIELIDAEGTEAVTMRRVASELGTGPASLYAHVGSREEILVLAHDEVLSQLPDVRTAGRPWPEVIREWSLALYELYHIHSDLARMSFADIPTGPRSLDVVESLLAACVDGGLPPQIASWLLDRLALYIAGDAFEGWLLTQRFAATDPTDPRTPEQRGHEYFSSIGDFFKALPSDRYPAITSNVTALIQGDGRQRFEFGIDLMIAGAVAMAGTLDTP